MLSVHPLCGPHAFTVRRMRSFCRASLQGHHVFYTDDIERARMQLSRLRAEIILERRERKEVEADLRARWPMTRAVSP